MQRGPWTASSFISTLTLIGDKALFRMRIADGKIEEFARQPEVEYSWSGVAPDGSPLTTRAVKIEEIYALDVKLP
jgi:hypothetical protein